MHLNKLFLALTAAAMISSCAAAPREKAHVRVGERMPIPASVIVYKIAPVSDSQIRWKRAGLCRIQTRGDLLAFALVSQGGGEEVVIVKYVPPHRADRHPDYCNENDYFLMPATDFRRLADEYGRIVKAEMRAEEWLQKAVHDGLKRVPPDFRE